jgi:phenylalanyl-tRNA synthetase beta chain
MAGVWRVTPPPFRFDLAIETDLIEEVARVYGYDRLPSSMPALEPELRRWMRPGCPFQIA